MTPTTPTHEIERQQLDIERDGLKLTLYVSYETVDPDTQEATYTGHPENAHPIARVVLDEAPPDWSAVTAWILGSHRKIWIDGLSNTPGRLILPFDGHWQGKFSQHTYSVIRGTKAAPTETVLEIHEADEGARPYAFQPGDGTTHLVLDHFSGGSGTQLDPYIIENVTELQAIKDTPAIWGAYFKLASDIDGSAMSAWDSGKGWVTLGIDSPRFSGLIDFDSHSLTGFWANRPTENYIGLVRGNDFGALPTVKNGKIYGAIVGRDSVGTFCCNKRAVEDCDNYADVTGCNNVGGVGGYHTYCVRCRNYGRIEATAGQAGGIQAGGGSSTISYSINYGAVIATGSAGGIAPSSSPVSYSANHGRVVSYEGLAAGIIAIATSNDGIQIQNSYNAGDITGVTGAGGIRAVGGGDNNCWNGGTVRGPANVGGIFGDSGTSGNSTNSFNTGLVEGTGSSPSNIGAFGGWLRAGRTITNGHYYNYAGSPPGVGLNEGTGSPTAQSTAEYFHAYTNAPMSSWDFVSIWDSGPAGAWFPVLKSQGAFIEHLWRPVIVDADGPVAGATVTLVDASGVTQASYVTDASGLPAALIYLPETSLVTSPAFAITTHTPYTVTVAATGYTALPAVVPLTADQRGVLYLQAGVLPAVADVRDGVQVGKGVGTRVDALAENTRFGTSHGDPASPIAGRLKLTTANNLRAGIGIGTDGAEVEGNIVIASANDLRLGVGNGAAGTEEVGKIVLPTAGQMIVGAGAGVDGTEIEGDVVLPPKSAVLINEPFGPAAAQLGELVPVRTSERHVLRLPQPLRLEVRR